MFIKYTDININTNRCSDISRYCFVDSFSSVWDNKVIKYGHQPSLPSALTRRSRLNEPERLIHGLSVCFRVIFRICRRSLRSPLNRGSCVFLSVWTFNGRVSLKTRRSSPVVENPLVFVFFGPESRPSFGLSGFCGRGKSPAASVGGGRGLSVGFPAVLHRAAVGVHSRNV